jgi:Tfp pilus assembly protein PilN
MSDIRDRLIPVKDHSGLYRDPKTNAILCDNQSEIDRLKEIKQARKQEKQDLENLKTEVGEIKDLLKELIQKVHQNG